MNFIFYVIVLILEILFYSLFMFFCKKTGKFYKYILSFVLITIAGFFVSTQTLISYLILVLMITFSLKYIVKVKTTLYDMLIIVIMLLIKIFIEMIVILGLFKIIENAYILSFIAGIIKILFVLLLNNKLNRSYNNLKEIWNNNNFYIRYLFSVVLFLYTIISCLFLIF